MIYRTIIFAALCLLLAGCSGSQHDARLQQLAAQIDDDPHSAVEALDSLNGSTFSEADRHYYDLLLIKARDKAYIFHTSDSLILDVINYYADHQDANLYAEALYYGGRVYSDMGDYPSALHYFQSALDLLPADTPNLKLRGNVLSQTGRLLDTLRLFDQASPYIEEVIKLDSICKDTINYVYDLQLLSEMYYRANNYDKAEQLIRRALCFGDKIPRTIDAKSRMHLSGIKFREGIIDSALILMRNIPDEVNPMTRTAALSYAAQIYLAAGISDTAYMYAQEILNDPDKTFHGTAYHVLLSKEIRHLMNQNVVDNLISDYEIYLLEDFDKNEWQQVIVQQSYYNYQLHERERQKAEQAQFKLQRSIICILAIVFILIIIVFYLRYRNKAQLLKLHIALENINKLTEKLNIKSEEGATAVVKTGNVAELRLQLRNKFIELAKSDKQPKTVDAAIICSEAFAELRNFIDNEKSIKDDDELWGRIEATVLGCAPNFKTNLHLLTGGKLSRSDYRTALLIRCGITPSEMAILLGRSKGAISSRREYLGYKIFDEKLGTKLIDDIIRLL
jgi:tetratricopeptide (TPR) repeat protein